MKMRKLAAALLAVLMLCSIIPFSAAAASASATITFDSVSKRTEFDTSHQVWQENGITVTNNKGASTSSVADYAAPARFYKSSTLIVEYPGMTKIEFACNTTAYATALQGVIANATVEGKVVTVTLNGVDSFSCDLTGGQVRMDAITVYGEGGAPVVPPVEPDEPEIPDEPDQPVIPDGPELTIADAIALGQTFAHNAFSESKYYVTGVITEVYNTQYGNMKLADEDGNILTIYGTWNEDGTVRYDALENAPVAGDTVVLYGVIGQYNGTSQMKNGWIMGIVPDEGGDTPDEPDEPDTPDAPTGDSATLDLTDKANRTEYSSSKQVWKQNGITVTNEKGSSTANVGDYGNPGRFYKSSTVTIAYPGMTAIVIDSVTYDDNDYAAGWAVIDDANATATVLDGNVTIEFANAVDSITWEQLTSQVRAYTITVYINGATPEQPEIPETPDTPDTPDTPSTPSTDLVVVTEPDVDVAYKFGMIQSNVSATTVYYLAGGMSSYYMASTNNAASAIDVYLEETDGGYYMYTLIGGAKTYINMVVSGTHVNGAYEATASTVYTYDADYQTVIAEIDGAYYWFGTRNDKQYTTVGPCNIEYNGFYCQFYGENAGSDTPDTPVDPEPDTPDTPDEPDVPEDGELDTTLTYLFGMVQENVSTEDIYFLNGEMNSYYMDTTTDEYEAIAVYLEETAGGYYLYALDEDDNKVYINMVVSGTHVNGAYEYTASTVYTYDWDLWTLVSEVNGELYAFGTRNDKTYTTMGPVKVSYNGFHADLYPLIDECEHQDEVVEEIAPTCGEDGSITYVCVLCGGEYIEVIPATGEHTYDDQYDADCNVCGDIREVPEKPAEFVGSIVASTVEGSVGDTVSINVSLTNNPGIISAKIKVYFDASVLKFVSFVDGNFSASGYSYSDPAEANEKGYVIINWCDATKPNNTADLLATLNFEILEGAAEGLSAITLEFNCRADIFNAADETVWFDGVNGGVQIVTETAVSGDANGDSKVNNKDLALLQQYLADWDVELDEDVCDVNGDGKVNNKDLALLQQYLADWDVELL